MSDYKTYDEQRNPENLLENMPEIKGTFVLFVHCLTARSYRDFILDIRDFFFVSGKSYLETLPRQEKSLNLHLFVSITRKVTLKISPKTLCVWAFSNDSFTWFEYHTEGKTRTKDSIMLPYTESYPSMLGYYFDCLKADYLPLPLPLPVGSDTSNIGEFMDDFFPLGREPIVQAAIDLCDLSCRHFDPKWARALATLCVTICEAVRFEPILDHVCENFSSPKPMGGSNFSLVHHWGTFSRVHHLLREKKKQGGELIEKEKVYMDAIEFFLGVIKHCTPVRVKVKEVEGETQEEFKRRKEEKEKEQEKKDAHLLRTFEVFYNENESLVRAKKQVDVCVVGDSDSGIDTVSNLLHEAETMKYRFRVFDQKEKPRARCAVLVVSSSNRSGLEKTKEAAEKAFSEGFKQVVCFCNKIGPVFDENDYKEMKEKASNILRKVGFNVKNVHFIPISATQDVEKLSWYEGPTLLQAMNIVRILI